jgi:hypothetical protein
MRIAAQTLLICVLAAAFPLAAAEPDRQVADDVVAVNVLLLPDEQMTARARELNHALRQTYPAGFALDASHVPHISLLQGYVRSRDLADLYSAVEKATQKRSLTGRQLNVSGLEHKPWDDKELTNIKIEKTPELEAFQADLVAALSPYLVHAGDKAAFVTSNADAGIDQRTIEYVRTFVQERTGKRFEPHVTVGISDAATARKVTAQHSASTKVTIASVAVFQLGIVGTARKELWRQLD